MPAIARRRPAGFDRERQLCAKSGPSIPRHPTRSIHWEILPSVFATGGISQSSSPVERGKTTPLQDQTGHWLCRLERMARSVTNLCSIVKWIEEKNASLRILAMNPDTASPTGRLMLNVIGPVARFDREMMLERQRGASRRPKVRTATKAKPTARQGRRCPPPGRRGRHP